LKDDEKEILKMFLVKNKRTLSFSVSNGCVANLCQKKLIYQSSSLGIGNPNFGYSIHDRTFDILEQNEEYLLPTKIVKKNKYMSRS